MALILIILVCVILYVWFAYNSLVSMRVRVREAWSDIDTQLKRRYDLIPNLVSTVKGYMAYESDTFEKVVEARSRAMATTGHGADRAESENQLSASLKTLFALSEAYPDLKANQNFLELQQQLSDTEDRVQASRRFYNSVVLELNTRVEKFPSNLIAKQFKFEKENFFELAADEKEVANKAPDVSF